MAHGTCSISGCGKTGRIINGVCEMHYRRKRVDGDYGEPGERRSTAGPAERFWAKVNKRGGIPDSLTTAGECWLWTGYRQPRGYGVFGLAGRALVLAHRFSYETSVGPVPMGMELDHLCRVTSCVNPAHLEAVTHLVNVRRGRAGQKR